MEKRFSSEKEMIEFGEEIGKNLSLPSVIELIGDVGTGKTTITKGIAKGLEGHEIRKIRLGDILNKDSLDKIKAEVWNG